MPDGDDFDLGVELTPTPAMIRDEGDTVFQCAFCGTLVATPYSSLWGHRDTSGLGPCPACEHRDWWPQRTPVGPYSRLVRIARRVRAQRQSD